MFKINYIYECDGEECTNKFEGIGSPAAYDIHDILAFDFTTKFYYAKGTAWCWFDRKILCPRCIQKFKLRIEK